MLERLCVYNSAVILMFPSVVSIPDNVDQSLPLAGLVV